MNGFVFYIFSYQAAAAIIKFGIGKFNIRMEND